MARAKKTARADARRKYRAEQGLPPDPIDGDETSRDAARAGPREPHRDARRRRPSA